MSISDTFCIFAFMNQGSKLLDIKSLSELIGLPQRTIRSMVQNRKIPFLKLGHRTMRFDEDKVRRALDRFEVRTAGK